MNRLYTILEFNKNFVDEQAFKDYETSRFPDKKMVILSCMDTRLVELLPRAMNLKNGDTKIIKNAGAIVSHPFGSVMKSILIALYELKAEEVYVIGHHDCGMSKIDSHKMLNSMSERGIAKETFDILENAGISLHKWLSGFASVEDSVKNSVEIIKNHPLIPKDVPIHGLIIDPHTGKLNLIVDGYKEQIK